MFKRLLVLLTAICVLSGTFAGCTEEKSDSYKIGLSTPLTGEKSEIGKHVSYGAQMMVDMINEYGGIEGETVELIVMDDCNDPETARKNCRKMLRQGICVSLGTPISQTCAAFAEEAEKKGLFILTPTAWDDGIPEYENTYQMCLSETNRAVFAAQKMNGVQSGDLYVVYNSEDREYSMVMYEKFMTDISDGINVLEVDISKGMDISGDTAVLLLLDTDDSTRVIEETSEYVTEESVYFAFEDFEDGDCYYRTEGVCVNEMCEFDCCFDAGTGYIFDTEFSAYYENIGSANRFSALSYDAAGALYSAIVQALDEGIDFPADIKPSEASKILNGVLENGFVFDGYTGVTSWKNGYADKKLTVHIINPIRDCSSENER